MASIKIGQKSMKKQIVFHKKINYNHPQNTEKNYVKTLHQLVIQFPPQYRTINFDYNYYYMNFPFYQIFIILAKEYASQTFRITGSNQFVFAKKSSIKNANDIIYPIYFPHVYAESGEICQAVTRNHKNLESAVDSYINTFWQAENYEFLESDEFDYYINIYNEKTKSYKLLESEEYFGGKKIKMAMDQPKKLNEYLIKEN